MFARLQNRARLVPIPGCIICCSIFNIVVLLCESREIGLHWLERCRWRNDGDVRRLITLNMLVLTWQLCRKKLWSLSFRLIGV